MSINLVTTLTGHPGPFTDQGNRTILQRSDGVWVMAQKVDDAEDVKFFHSTNKSTWTPVGTYTFSPSPVDDLATYGGTWALAIDSSDAIHMAFAQAARTVGYRKFTWNGSSAYTMSSVETAIAAPASATEAPHMPAIEVLDSGVVVIGCVSMFSPTSAGNTSSFRVRARGTGSTWGTEVNIASGATTADAYSVACNLARDIAAASGGTQKIVLSGCGGSSTNHLILVLSVTLTTGAIATTATVNNANLSRVPYGNKTYLKVFPHLAGRWRIAMQYNAESGPGFGTFTAAEIDSAGLVISTGITTTYGFAQWVPGGGATAAWLPDRIIMCGINWINSKLLFIAAVYDGTSWTFHQEAAIALPVPALPTTERALFSIVFGGDSNRNIAAPEHLFGYASLDPGQATSNVYAAYLDVPTHLPTGISPINLSTISTDIPVLKATPTPALNLGQYATEWQFALDSGFTTGVRNVMCPNFSSEKVIQTFLMPLASQLTNGTWYRRARVVDYFGQQGPWSTTFYFVVAHAPSATPTAPGGSVSMAYGSGTVSFQWNFSDGSPVDAQSAYQIQVEVNSTGAVVADSTKISAGGFEPNNTYGSPTVGRGGLSISTTYKDVLLRWRVRVWDSDDTTGAWSGYEIFLLGDAPSIVVTKPTAGGTVDNPQPLFTWTFAGAGGRTQSRYRVTITNTASSAVVHESGWKTGAGTSYQPPQAYLSNTSNYSVTVFVQDSAGIDGQGSAVAFSTSWTAPAVPSGIAISASAFDTVGFVTIGWNAAVTDADFHAWRIYRRKQGETEFVSIYETTNPLTNTFNDWYVLSGVAYQYNVVQVANRFGALVESVATWQSAVTGTSTHYWLLHPDDNTKNIKVFHVTSDDYTEEYESETILLMGRGRKVDYGSRWGFTGTLSCEIRGYDGMTARQIKTNLENIKAELRELFLRNPFGDLWQVGIGDLQVSRVPGVGTNEYCTVTLPYQEVL